MRKLILFILLIFITNVSYTDEETEEINPKEKALYCSKLAIMHNENSVTLMRVALTASIFLKEIDLITASVNFAIYELSLAISLGDEEKMTQLSAEIDKKLKQIDAIYEKSQKLAEREQELTSANENLKNNIKATECGVEDITYENFIEACDHFKDELSDSLNCKAGKIIEESKKRNGPKPAHSGVFNV
jgi:vacuolar-type H+-ATPase subunit I/STV1